MKARVLIVDDLAFMRNALREILEVSGFEVVGEAENGKVGIHEYRRLRPDLVLMDITMPEMDGLESLRRIVEHDRLAKVVMCSAMGQQEYILAAIRNGAKDFVIKPFKPERVVSALRKAYRAA